MPFLILIVLIATSPVYAEEISGRAEIIDGDSIRIGDQEIILHGIDAPELKQTCLVDGKQWQCGSAATETLVFVTMGSEIRCSWTAVGENASPLATCFRKDMNLNAMMVEVGMALASQTDTNAYAAQEEVAKHQNRGLWDSVFVAPWDWRDGVRTPDRNTTE